MHMSALPACMYVHHYVPGAHGGKELSPLELQMIWGYHTNRCCRTECGSPVTAISALNC